VPEFVPGLRLSERFYREAVAPILEREFPDRRHSAGLLGYGSEVLGYDTVRSTDHEWGPRLLLFLDPGDEPALAAGITEALRHALPHRFIGYATGFGPPDDEGVRLPAMEETGPVDHRVDVTTLPRFLADRLGIEHYDKLEPLDWLLFSDQALLEVTAGAVFHDGLGELQPARAALASYPRDVWLYLLATQWTRIAQQEAFVGRTGEAGDELGSVVIAAALVRDVMRLAFLLERRYAPYAKWFGTAFARLAVAPRLGPPLAAAVGATTWRERERHLSTAYEIVAATQNGLGLTEPLPGRVSPFHGRPFLVIHGALFADALRARIVDERVRAWPANVGSVDQHVDSTDVLARAPLRRRLRALFDGQP